MEQGWECHKCHNVYAPNIPFCLYCWFNQKHNNNDNNNNNNNNTLQPVIENKHSQENLIIPPEQTSVQTHIEQTDTISNQNNILQNKILILDKVDITLPKLKKEPIYPQSNTYPNTKIYLGGIGHAKERAINRKFKIPYILDSIIDLPLQPSKLVRQYFDYIKNNKIEYLMDSGAYTYMSNPKKSFNLQEHLKQYCYYINEFDIKNFIELDLDVFMSIEEVENIRKKIYLETHKMPIIVYHPERGYDYWINMCKENDFIAIGGLVTSKNANTPNRIKELSDMCDEAHMYNTQVHGLGFTPLSLLNTKTMFFDTVDSTSWNASRRDKLWVLNEQGQLVYQDKPETIFTADLQEIDLEAWATFSTNYVGGLR